MFYILGCWLLTLVALMISVNIIEEYRRKHHLDDSDD